MNYQSKCTNDNMNELPRRLTSKKQKAFKNISFLWDKKNDTKKNQFLWD